MKSAATDSRLQSWQVAWWVEDDFGQLGDVWVLVSWCEYCVNMQEICVFQSSKVCSPWWGPATFGRSAGEALGPCQGGWASGIPISSRNPSEVCLSAGIQQGWDEGSSLWSVAELSDAELHFKSFHGKRISIDDWRTVMSHDCVIQGLAPQQPFGTLPRQMLQRKWCSSCRILLRDGYWISVPHKVHIALYSRLAFSKLELSFVLVLTLYSFWPGGANEILATRRDCWRLPLADLALCRAACGVTVYTPWKTLD